ncbi:MAG TPA: GNAT family N-acetyltransferase [Rubricoccaceae bacterium]|jgi:GNAT superfamily N-acetyltransferase
MSDLPVTVRRVPAATVHPLRTRVLRPDWPPGRLLTLDADSEAIHVAAEFDGEIVGVATVYPEAPDERARGPIPEEAFAPGAAWQLRGMATAAAAQGQGIGTLVLAAAVEAVRDGGGRMLWCHARVAAVPFYERAGLVAVTDIFEIGDIGPHVVMWRRVGDSGGLGTG